MFWSLHSNPFNFFYSPLNRTCYVYMNILKMMNLTLYYGIILFVIVCKQNLNTENEKQKKKNQFPICWWQYCCKQINQKYFYRLLKHLELNETEKKGTQHKGIQLFYILIYYKFIWCEYPNHLISRNEPFGENSKLGEKEDFQMVK